VCTTKNWQVFLGKEPCFRANHASRPAFGQLVRVYEHVHARDYFYGFGKQKAALTGDKCWIPCTWETKHVKPGNLLTVRESKLVKETCQGGKRLARPRRASIYIPTLNWAPDSYIYNYIKIYARWTPLAMALSLVMSGSCRSFSVCCFCFLDSYDYILLHVINVVYWSLYSYAVVRLEMPIYRLKITHRDTGKNNWRDNHLYLIQKQEKS
jgi:hypothetical protein